MTIIEYNNYQDITVQFDDGYTVKARCRNFLRGSLCNPYDKSICGIGYIGEGNIKTWSNGKATKEYQVWKNMIQRCYGAEKNKNKKAYIDCTVADEWLCFMAFAKWYQENYYEIKGFRTELDKDILVKGNRAYSPETCLLVPKLINQLFIKQNSIKKDLPIGVVFKDKKYRARCTKEMDKKGMTHLGYFKTPEEAFQAYKIEKERIIKQVADEYKNQIPLKLYEALYRYEVEITD